ncbi:hypothetical protein ADK54_18940 [Streptomyces sp. WM6378]|nr:hypothetical protein ADK54_18940 [Streptomyces sp. WM6378]
MPMPAGSLVSGTSGAPGRSGRWISPNTPRTVCSSGSDARTWLHIAASARTGPARPLVPAAHGLVPPLGCVQCTGFSIVESLRVGRTPLGR